MRATLRSGQHSLCVQLHHSKPPPPSPRQVRIAARARLLGLALDMSLQRGALALCRQDMSPSRHTGQLADNAQAPVVGVSSHWPSQSEKARHTHFRHQLMYSQKGVIHVSTLAGSWILPPTRSIWISGGTPHALLVKRPVELIILWVDRDAPGAPNWTGCNVVSVSPLIRDCSVFVRSSLGTTRLPLALRVSRRFSSSNSKCSSRRRWSYPS